MIDDDLEETLYEHLDAQGLLEYGSHFKRSIVWGFLDMVDTPTKTRQEHEAFRLKELNAINPVRTALLNQGKYLKGEGDYFRVFLPSENARKVAGYFSSSKRALRRAQILSAATPSAPGEASQTDAKIAMHLDSIAREVQHQKNME